MKKILYVLLHGTSSADRYFNIKETWGKDVDCLFCSDYEDIERGIMKFSNDTSYGSNEEKHVNAIKHLSDNVDDYEWFFLCDDDTFVNTKKLEGMLYTFDKELIHGQSILGCWHTDKTLDYCSGGAGYLIHNELIKIIGKNIKVLGTGLSLIHI